MKAVLLHGTGSTPSSYWFPYMRQRLEEMGYSVVVPQLPNAENPTLEACLPLVRELGIDTRTLLIGHSSGAALILGALEELPAKKAILVAGFYKPLEEGKPEPMVKSSYDWERMKSNCKEFVFINSDNDPWGCTDAMGKEMLERLGGTLVVPHGEGHMGSTSFNQPYTEFPLLMKFVQD